MKFFYLICSTIIVMVVIVCLPGGCAKMKYQTGQTPQKLVKLTAQGQTITSNYLLYLPEAYGKKKSWPLILFLHGAGERGSDLYLVKLYGPPKFLETKKDFPFIVVSPQCPVKDWWPNRIDSLMALLDDVTDRYNVDIERVYLTGLSMGGYGTWALAGQYPERFAAIVPICGQGDVSDADALKDTPMWVFHGAKDTTVPLSNSEEMVAAVREAGGNVKFTIYPEAGHDSWTETYNNEQLYEWLLKQKKRQKK